MQPPTALRREKGVSSQRPGAEFDAFVLGQSSSLLRAAVLLTGDPAAAEDLLQDVLERLYVAWALVDEPLPYVRRALVNSSRSRWRSRSRRPELPLLAGHDAAVADRADEGAGHDRVVRALRALPPRQRAVVVLRYLEDLSEADTAALLGCSVGTVKSQASRALARLRTQIDLTPGRA